MKHQSIIAWAFAAAAIALSACGSVSSNLDAGGGTIDGAPPGDFTIGIDQPTVNQTISGSHEVGVGITRGTGFTDSVALTATGLPAGVSATFDVTSVPDSANASNMTLTVATTAAPGTSTVTVTGTAGALSHSATLELTLSTVTVSGRLRSAQMGITVRIVGKTATSTDTNGNFTFTDVVVPYDIYVIGGEGLITNPAIPAVNYYKGLTRVDPVLVKPSQFILGTVLGTAKSGTISGTRSGGSTAVADQVMHFWESGGTVTTANGNVTAYANVDADWANTTTDTAKLFAIQITRGALSRPTAYPGYGSTSSTVTNAANTAINVALTAPTTAALTGTVTQPGGFPVPTLTLSQKFGDRVLPIWPATNTNDATSAIPLIVDGTSSLHGTSTLSGSTTEFVYPALNAATDVTFAMPAPPVITGPVNNATNVNNSTPFEYTFPTNSVFEVSMTSSSANFHVFTTTGSVTIPNVTELPLPSGTSFNWTVEGFGPAGDANRAADADPLINVGTAEFTGTMHFKMNIPSRTFTTQ